MRSRVYGGAASRVNQKPCDTICMLESAEREASCMGCVLGANGLHVMVRALKGSLVTAAWLLLVLQAPSCEADGACKTMRRRSEEIGYTGEGR